MEINKLERKKMFSFLRKVKVKKTQGLKKEKILSFLKESESEIPPNLPGHFLADSMLCHWLNKFVDRRHPLCNRIRAKLLIKVVVVVVVICCCFSTLVLCQDFGEVLLVTEVFSCDPRGLEPSTP